jgi:hypothetical protein
MLMDFDVVPVVGLTLSQPSLLEAETEYPRAAPLLVLVFTSCAAGAMPPA